MRCSTPGCSKRGVHWHHILSRQAIKANVRDKIRRRQLLTDPRNLLLWCLDCHMSHENWSGHGERRMTRDRIPRHTWDWAQELGVWAVVRLEQDYPVRGPSPHMDLP